MLNCQVKAGQRKNSHKMRENVRITTKSPSFKHDFPLEMPSCC